MPIIYIKNADFSGSGLGKYPTNPAYYQDETKAIIATNFLESLTTHVNKDIFKEALNNFILSLKTIGAFQKMDYLHVPLLAQNRSEMSLNFKTALKETGMGISSASMANVNFGYRPLSNGTAVSNADKKGIHMPINYNYDYEDFHFGVYHNKLGQTLGSIIERGTSVNFTGTSYNNNFFSFSAGVGNVSGRLGYNSDANRITLGGFDTNFGAAQVKLFGINTMVKNGVIKADTYTTGNSSAGEKSNSATIPANYFDKTAKTTLTMLGGENTAKYFCNACVISAGKGLTDIQWAGYRAACDAFDLELLGSVPTFTLY
jgi:hypothetical protein